MATGVQSITISSSPGRSTRRVWSGRSTRRASTWSASRAAYPLLQDPEPGSWGLQLASDPDIIAMKIEAIAGRGARKDFIDLRILCAAGWTLERAFEAFERKYGTQRSDRYHRLRALAYFDDAEREPMPDMLVPFDWQETRRFFAAEASRLLATEGAGEP
ncbi:MAG TPA: nucleotidyl transferase AbiEii/AbiGii toxin family protein [Kofleriaceae bacterium]|nr:nucleotidyl transferase AbiEii/AbiGii toxin family protein [Kofleriaceae bacterium]